MPSAPEIQPLLSGLTVQRTDRGGLLIEAPPETAATLAALFSGIGQLLQPVRFRPVWVMILSRTARRCAPTSHRRQSGERQEMTIEGNCRMTEKTL